MAHTGDDDAISIPLETIKDSPTTTPLQAPSLQPDMGSRDSPEDDQAVQAMDTTQSPEGAVSFITVWLEWLRKILPLLSALEKGLILALSLLTVWFAWTTLIQAKRQESLDEWSSRATFRDDCRQEKERIGLMSLTCNRSLSIPLAPPSPRSVSSALLNVTSSSGLNASLSSLYAGQRTYLSAYLAFAVLLGLSVAVCMQHFRLRLRSTSPTPSWVANDVPRLCALSNPINTKLTTKTIDYYIDVFAGDPADRSLANTPVAWHSTHSVCAYKDTALRNERTDSGEEVIRISQVLRSASMTKEVSSVPMSLILNPVAGLDTVDERGNGQEPDSKSGCLKKDGIVSDRWFADNYPSGDSRKDDIALSSLSRCSGRASNTLDYLRKWRAFYEQEALWADYEKHKPFAPPELVNISFYETLCRVWTIDEGSNTPWSMPNHSPGRPTNSYNLNYKCDARSVTRGWGLNSLELHPTKIHPIKIHLIHSIEIHPLKIHLIKIHLIKIHLIKLYNTKSNMTQLHITRLHITRLHITRIRTTKLHTPKPHANKPYAKQLYTTTPFTTFIVI